MARFNVARSLRLSIYIRDRFSCVWCRCVVIVGAHNSKHNAATLDHIRCRKRGGKHIASNLVTACARCNCTRRDTAAAAWAKMQGTTLRRVRAAQKTQAQEHRDTALAYLRTHRRSMRRVGKALGSGG